MYFYKIQARRTGLHLVTSSLGALHHPRLRLMRLCGLTRLCLAHLCIKNIYCCPILPIFSSQTPSLEVKNFFRRGLHIFCHCLHSMDFIIIFLNFWERPMMLALIVSNSVPLYLINCSYTPMSHPLFIIIKRWCSLKSARPQLIVLQRILELVAAKKHLPSALKV